MYHSACWNLNLRLFCTTGEKSLNSTFILMWFCNDSAVLLNFVVINLTLAAENPILAHSGKQFCFDARC